MSIYLERLILHMLSSDKLSDIKVVLNKAGQVDSLNRNKGMDWKGKNCDREAKTQSEVRFAENISNFKVANVLNKTKGN